MKKLHFNSSNYYDCLCKERRNDGCDRKIKGLKSNQFIPENVEEKIKYCKAVQEVLFKNMITARFRFSSGRIAKVCQ